MSGSDFDAETRKRISDKLTGRVHLISEETKQKISAARMGQKLSEEHKRRISETLTGRTASTETLQRQSEVALRRFAEHGVSEETRQKISALHTGKALSEEHKRRISEANTGKVRSAEFKQNLSYVMSGRLGPSYPRSAESKVRQSESMRATWQDPIYIARWSEGMRKVQHRTPNQSELQLQSILDKYFLGEWKYVGDGNFWIERRNPDFVNVNGRKQVIEMFGIYWHDEADVEPLINHYKKYGFDCLIFWECDIWDEDEVAMRLREAFTGVETAQ